MLPRLENLAKRRRRMLVLTSAFILSGLGGLYGAYFAFRGGASVNSFEQGGREALTQYVEEQIHAQDFRNLCDEYLKKCSKLKEQHAQTIQNMVNHYSAAIERVEDEETGEKLSIALHDESRKILQRFSGDFNQLRRDFLNARSTYSISRIDISAKVRPRNSREEMMMPGVCEEIAQDFSQYESKFLMSSSDGHDANLLLMESEKLEEKIAEKNDILRKRKSRVERR